MKRFIFLLVSSFQVTSTVMAQDVFMCEVNGKKTFSQIPCKDMTVTKLELTDSDALHAKEKIRLEKVYQQRERLEKLNRSRAI